MTTQKQVIYGPYTATVRKAKVPDGVQRDMLIARAYDQAYGDGDPMRNVAIVMYPTAAACSTFESSEPLPDGAFERNGLISLEFFATLDDAFVRAWVDTALELNPHWNWAGGASEVEIREKKE